MVWNAELERAGPGLLLRDILSDRDPQVLAVVRVIAVLQPDVLLLTGVDHDRGLAAARALVQRLEAAGAGGYLPFALSSNRGRATGLDLDGDGRAGGAGDAQGRARFAGQGSMLLLSRLPVDEVAARDFSTMLWRDLPGAKLPPGLVPGAAAIWRLSSTGHWEMPLILPGGERLNLLAWHAAPPAFDGPDARNRRRNHDEAAFWPLLLEGRLGFSAPQGPVVLMGTANLDPEDGDGWPEAMRRLLAHPRLQDPAPRSARVQPESRHRGDPALVTAVFAQTGGLRVEYVLPDAALTVAASGVLRPAEGGALFPEILAASRHFPVWVDILLPE